MIIMWQGASFLLNTEKSRNNQAKVPNRTPFFYMYIWAPYQKIIAKTYHELIKNNNINVGFVERALVKMDVNVTWQMARIFF